jgi:hypothetical protein
MISPMPLTWKWLAITIVAGLAAMTRWCPSTRIVDNHLLMGEPVMISRTPGMVLQLRDPWVGLTNLPRFHNPLYVASRWRLLPPFAGHLLNLNPETYFTALRSGAWWMLLLATAYAWRLGGTRACLLAAVVTATASPWLNAAENMQFDGWAIGTLLVAAFTPNRTVAWAVIALGPWIDERFALMLPVALIARAWATGTNPWREATGLVPYALARAVAMAMGDTVAGNVKLVTVGWNAPDCLNGWALAWRLSLVILAVGGWTLLRHLRPSLWWLAIGAPVGLALTAWLATDYTRASSWLLPVALIGCMLPAMRRLQTTMLCLVLLNFTLPYWNVCAVHKIPTASLFSPPPGTWPVQFN